MTAAALIDKLTAAGVGIRVAGGDLKLSPAAALDAATLAEVRRLKPEIVAHLAPALRCILHPARCYDPAAARAWALTEPADRRGDLLRYADAAAEKSVVVAIIDTQGGTT